MWFARFQIYIHAFERIFFSNFYFYGSFNAEFREDFRHGNNSSVTLKSPSLPKFKNIFHVGAHLGQIFIYLFCVFSVSMDHILIHPCWGRWAVAHSQVVTPSPATRGARARSSPTPCRRPSPQPLASAKRGSPPTPCRIAPSARPPRPGSHQN